MYSDFFEKLCYIHSISTSHEESWSNLTFKGVYKGSCSKSFFEELYNECETFSTEVLIHFFIGKSTKNISEFLSELYDGDEWKISINKECISKSSNGFSNNFFFFRDKFIEWSKGTNPFTEDYPLNKSRYEIIVHGLSESFSGYNFIVCNNEVDFNIKEIEDYNEEEIIKNIHYIGSSPIIIKPLNHLVILGKVNKESYYFFRNSILILLASLCNEFNNDDKIIINGYRRILLKLGINYIGDETSKKYQDLLWNAVLWIYQKNERCDLRLKLLLERITLDIDYSLPYFQGLYTIIENATTQAKERYSFIIYDRKDLYQKELKDLLKDIKNLTDNISTKIRVLLSNLLRDVLAAFILVGITLFSKVDEIEKLLDNKLISYVFISFGIYFLISVILQLLVDSFDIYHSFKELDYWKLVSREYMSKDEYKRHIKNAYKKRLNNSIRIYLFILLMYIMIAIFCFKLPYIWNLVVQSK